MIALLIGYEAISRFLSPVAIHFREAIPIAVVGLLVNIISAWLLSGGDHHGHGHDHAHDDAHDHAGHEHAAHEHGVVFEEQVHSEHEEAGPASAALRDNSIRSAYVHVIADAAVSILAITGLVFASAFGWLWMDPLAGIVGALVIANWSYSLLRDTGGILLDMTPDPALAEKLRKTVESDGDRLIDLHVWRLGPGHLGAVVSVVTGKPRDAAFYRAVLSRFTSLSHVTVEVTRPVPSQLRPASAMPR